VAVAASLWLLLLLFGSPWIAGGAPDAPAGPLPAAGLSPVTAGLVMTVVGLLAGIGLPPALDRSQRGAAGGIMALLWAALLLAQQLIFDLPDTALVVAGGLAGLAAGMVLGGLAGPTLQRWPGGRTARGLPLLGLVAACCAAASVLIPFAPDQALTAPFAAVSPADLVLRIPQQIYALIKASMLWVPLGFLAVAAERPGVLRDWAPAAVIGFLLVCWPFAGTLQVSDLLEVLGIAVGVWVGLWIGERTASATAAHEPAPGAAVTATAAVAAEPDTGPPARGPLPPVAGSSPRRIRGETDSVPAAIPVAAAGAEPRPAAAALDMPAQDEAERRVEPSSSGEERGLGLALPRPHPWMLLPATALLALAAWGWWEFPRYQAALGIALLLYVLLLAVARHAWMVAIPALLPVLDLAPWSGRFFFDETDLFLLATLGVAALHRPDPRAGPFLARPLAILLGLFGATTLIATLAGLFPLSALDANAFSHYFSHYNALRVAKGFAWGFAVLLLLRWTVPKGSPLPMRLLTLGFLIGLAGVILIGLRERWQFAALLDFSEPYRITASFSSMHTGGSHLPAFLTLAVPFVWLWVIRLRDKTRQPLQLAAGVLLGLALFAGALYLVVSTVTRAAVLALVIELLLLAIFWLRGPRARGGRLAVSALLFAAMAAIAGTIVYMGTQGSYFQERASLVMRDAETRLSHWRQAVWMMDRDPATQLLGMGLGTFPETYLRRNPEGATPGNFSYASEDGDGHLVLGSGETLYLAQRVPLRPHQAYLLSFDLKGRKDPVRLTIPICEKHLLDSRDCLWRTYSVPGSGDWEHTQVRIDSGRIGRGGWLDRPPVELFLYNGEEDNLVAVDNLSLRDAAGTELLRNGDFSGGGDFWFFKTHDHLAWHIKNLWVSLLFEQGWAGFALFNLLMLGVLLHLFGPAWRGNMEAAAVLTALTGFLAVGLFASPFDAPRLTALFLTVLATGLHGVPAIAVARRTRRPALRRRKKPRRQRRPAADGPGIG
jgi:hypothetical protein